MSDLIKRADAIKAIWGDDINPSEDGMVFEAQSHIDRDIRLIPSADRPTRVYEYLRERIGDIVDSEAEFEAWFERMVWHVEECNRLADRPQGEWIGEADGYADGELVYDTWYCSNCDYAVDDDEPPTWNFCPNCGCRMKGADDE